MGLFLLMKNIWECEWVLRSLIPCKFSSKISKDGPFLNRIFTAHFYNNFSSLLNSGLLLNIVESYFRKVQRKCKAATCQKWLRLAIETEIKKAPSPNFSLNIHGLPLFSFLLVFFFS